MQTLCVIPARGGSKGIPGKNLIKLHGKPLLAWTCELAQRCPVARAIVSTDDEAIAAEADRCGLKPPFLRPAKLAEDDTPVWKVIKHALVTLGKRWDLVLVLQPTSPGRSVADVTACLDKMRATWDSVVAVAPCRRHPYQSAMVELSGRGHWSGPPGTEFMRRQALPVMYDRTGSIYVTRPEFPLCDNRLIGQKWFGYVQDAAAAITIDAPADLPEARKRLDIWRQIWQTEIPAAGERRRVRRRAAK